MDVAAQRTQGIDMRQVGRIVDEAPQMNIVLFGKKFQLVERADFFALVRRIGQTLAEEEQVRHGAYPTPRTTKGPKALATGSGSFFQVSMKKRYFGLVGLCSGMGWPGIRRKA